MINWYAINQVRELLVFSNVQFAPNTGLADRPSGQKDAEDLINAMNKRHFKCPPTNRYIGTVNLQDATNAVDKFATNPNLENCDMVAVCVMTHGHFGRQGECFVFSDGNKIPIFTFLKPILESTYLVNKPKIVLLQMCRGTENHWMSDSTPDAAVGRNYHSIKDCVIFHATAPGNLAWRNNQRGSIFISIFVEILNQYGDSMDFADIARLVCDKMCNLPEEVVDIGGQITKISFAPYLEQCLLKKIYLIEPPSNSSGPVDWTLVALSQSSRIDKLQQTNDNLINQLKIATTALLNEKANGKNQLNQLARKMDLLMTNVSIQFDLHGLETLKWTFTWPTESQHSTSDRSNNYTEYFLNHDPIQLDGASVYIRSRLILCDNKRKLLNRFFFEIFEIKGLKI